jgi:hypothetical protein
MFAKLGQQIYSETFAVVLRALLISYIRHMSFVKGKEICSFCCHQQVIISFMDVLNCLGILANI